MSKFNVRFLRLLFLLLIAAKVMVPAAMAPASPGDQPLRDTIVLRVGQMGFAGTTGIEYRLEPSGDWRAVNFVNEKTMEVVGEGKLAPDKLVALSRKLTNTDLAAVKAEAKTFEGVNPALVELRYLDETTTVTFPPGYTPDQPCPYEPSEPVCQFLELTDLIRSSLPTK